MAAKRCWGVPLGACFREKSTRRSRRCSGYPLRVSMALAIASGAKRMAGANSVASALGGKVARKGRAAMRQRPTLLAPFKLSLRARSARAALEEEGLTLASSWSAKRRRLPCPWGTIWRAETGESRAGEGPFRP
jgi:hypothetical protein